MAARKSSRLTTLIKRYLDLSWYLGILIVVILGVSLVATGLGFTIDPLGKQASMQVFLSFRIDESIAATANFAGLEGKETLISGQGDLNFQTHSAYAFGLTLMVALVTTLFYLYGIWQLRAVFASIQSGEPFAAQNPRRIRKIGFALVGWQIIMPLVRYFGGLAVIRDLDVRGVTLLPPIDYSLHGLVTGLAIIILADVLREAGELHSEQSLTI